MNRSRSSRIGDDWLARRDPLRSARPRRRRQLSLGRTVRLRLTAEAPLMLFGQAPDVTSSLLRSSRDHYLILGRRPSRSATRDFSRLGAFPSFVSRAELGAGHSTNQPRREVPIPVTDLIAKSIASNRPMPSIRNDDYLRSAMPTATICSRPTATSL